MFFATAIKQQTRPGRKRQNEHHPITANWKPSRFVGDFREKEGRNKRDQCQDSDKTYVIGIETAFQKRPDKPEDCDEKQPPKEEAVAPQKRQAEHLGRNIKKRLTHLCYDI